MKILITGAKGFIGSELINHFNRGFFHKHYFYPLNRQLIDLTNTSQVDNFFENNKFDAVIHCAICGGRRTNIDSLDMLRDNLLMFENIAKYRDNYKLLITFGSGAEFDRRYSIDRYKENDLGKHIPVDTYGLSKYIIAQRVQQLDNCINLRIFNVFGPNESDDRFIKTNLKNYINKEPMIIFRNLMMDFFGIDDLITVVEYCLDNYDKLKFKDLNLCYNKKQTLMDICNYFNTLSDYNVDIYVRNPRMANSYNGNNALLQSFNLNLIGFEKSISKVYDFLTN